MKDKMLPQQYYRATTIIQDHVGDERNRKRESILDEVF